MQERAQYLGGWLSISSEPGWHLPDPAYSARRLGRGLESRRWRAWFVDDHAVVRGGLRQFLADTDDLEITAEAASGLMPLRWWKGGLEPGAARHRLPDLNGLEVLKQIKRLRPNLPVLIFSMFSEDEFAIPSSRQGVGLPTR